MTTTVSPTIPTTILPNPIIKLEGGENANEGYVMVKIPDKEEYLHIVAYSYDPYSNERNIANFISFVLKVFFNDPEANY